MRASKGPIGYEAARVVSASTSTASYLINDVFFFFFFLAHLFSIYQISNIKTQTISFPQTLVYPWRRTKRKNIGPLPSRANFFPHFGDFDKLTRKAFEADFLFFFFFLLFLLLFTLISPSPSSSLLLQLHQLHRLYRYLHRL
ncbi:uncharacterized protein ARB_00460 [Trichophyton benhamiae CBS 112371]|uniref:Uncharacterized protein n=1 Tax=Arthroderma benhamiae (strain ATCC MYA-4681 / CBS 112371) TaxID=663331 RepID=D4AW95_ARTBC|nr:uncharacterized protein ARB_00460 [Trichophyton benhamiae CBS 112371]EFE32635.1 hypothetical protein ARB_00460 [Trichophyton benhamiae CBS 112371]